MSSFPQTTDDRANPNGKNIGDGDGFGGSGSDHSSSEGSTLEPSAAMEEGAQDTQEEPNNEAQNLSLVAHDETHKSGRHSDARSGMGSSGVDPSPGSPESASTPDDTPSVQGSAFSSPSSSAPASYGSLSRAHRPASLQPFERRFSSRLSPSPLGSPRVSSPAFLSPGSRQSSLSSNLLPPQDDLDTPEAPWDVVRWTKLKKITSQVFSEVGRRNFGRPTCLSVAAPLIVGTSKGLILVFDHQQVLKSIIGPGTKAIECGPITALAVSADHSTVAGGHATGYIFTWELSRPAKPFLQISPIDRARLGNSQGDGHVSDVAILHLGFLGTRHTALVSADGGGMAFSHLATRGLGAVGRSVKITRILGRYPPVAPSTDRPRKASSVLAFSPLPLGNVEQPTDGMGLTALLTPYLLVIVSTTPLAQTQHKAPRPKDVVPHSTLSGCLAWFPAVKLKTAPEGATMSMSRTKLVYCWSNILTILDVDAVAAVQQDKPAELQFRARSRWRSEESIVAVQWLGRSIIGVLTISQRLLILEDNSLRMTDDFDLLHKHIYHADLFSKQLRPVVEHLDENDESLHGVVADAFYMSFRAYKGRLFLLGFNDVSIGTLSNWADRLLAMMEDGDFIGAIALATSYHNGDADKLTVGLPEEDAARHRLVQEKLVDMMSASLRYTFGRRDQVQHGARGDKVFADLAAVCFAGCLSMRDMDFLFDDVYEAYEEGAAANVFFDTLEPYILDEAITAVPPNILKGLIAFYASCGRANRLEDMICRLDTEAMDTNQVITLCERHKLYDALIYVWTQALQDFITPLIQILTIVKSINCHEADHEPENAILESAMKVFPFLAYSFTGRVYPSGRPLGDSEAYSAKKDLYRFLFSSKVLAWPPGSGDRFLTRVDGGPEPSFPYLHLLLYFDSGSFMSMLNEAFEDGFLNGDADVSAGGAHVNGSQRSSAVTPTRQYIVHTLLGIMTFEDFESDDMVYFYMFLARNLPKYPQHIILPGTSLHQILVGLCNYPTETVRDDCQLSVEYLLSVYHPSDLQTLVPLFERAGFYRVLKSLYRTSQQYAKLVDTFLSDREDQAAVFGCIGDCFRPGKGLSRKQVNEVKAVIVNRARELADVDASRTAQTVQQHAHELLRPVLDALEDGSDPQYQYLKALVEIDASEAGNQIQGRGLPIGFVERYVQLMCKHDGAHVADFVGGLQSGDLRLDPVLPALEQSGAIDAAVVLMARDGLVPNAMQRLTKHIGTLETALTGLIGAAMDTPDAANTSEAVSGLLADIEKYHKVGIWLCQGQTRSTEQATKEQLSRPKAKISEVREEDLTFDEMLWLDLVDTIVHLTQNVTSAVGELAHSDDSAMAAQSKPIDTTKITNTLRTAVQQTFSALLAATTVPLRHQASKPDVSTSSPAAQQRRSQTTHHASFLRILHAFLARASRSSPSLSDLRAVLSEVLATYAFEETILALANRFLDKDAFAHVDDMYALRQRGWRPRSQACEGCRKRAWGPGAGADIWDAWQRRGELERQRRDELRTADAAQRPARGKGRNGDLDLSGHALEDAAGGASNGKGGAAVDSDESAAPLVVFACRHVWHRRCLETTMPTADTHDGPGEGRFRCPLCA